ncbi:MAG: hypothetical protein DME99_10540 [Verrucomicrobia bacterium]|nr:MAG: hypothetical protein DME99_10540 [Verrucomicrobiota bacterium]
MIVTNKAVAAKNASATNKAVAASTGVAAKSGAANKALSKAADDKPSQRQPRRWVIAPWINERRGQLPPLFLLVIPPAPTSLQANEVYLHQRLVSSHISRSSAGERGGLYFRIKPYRN